jgi:thiamine-phosphate pyrophosphorylase
VALSPAWRGLYAIVDPAFCRGRDPLDVAAAILRGGCAALQLRAKSGEPAAIASLARALHARCRAASVPFVVNDDVELAAAIGAEGVHLGQNDVAIETARTRLPDHVVIGLSTHSPAQALAAQARGANLIGVGPVFATRSKQDPDPMIGLSGLRAIRAAVQLPIVAIGGIAADNAASVAACGVELAAAIGALCGADDPEAAARTLHRTLR